MATKARSLSHLRSGGAVGYQLKPKSIPQPSQTRLSRGQRQQTPFRVLAAADVDTIERVETQSSQGILDTTARATIAPLSLDTP